MQHCCNSNLDATRPECEGNQGRLEGLALPDPARQVHHGLAHHPAVDGLVRPVVLGVRLLNKHRPDLARVRRAREERLLQRVARDDIVDDDVCRLALRDSGLAAQARLRLASHDLNKM